MTRSPSRTGSEGRRWAWCPTRQYMRATRGSKPTAQDNRAARRRTNIEQHAEAEAAAQNDDNERTRLASKHLYEMSWQELRLAPSAVDDTCQHFYCKHCNARLLLQEQPNATPPCCRATAKTQTALPNLPPEPLLLPQMRRNTRQFAKLAAHANAACSFAVDVTSNPPAEGGGIQRPETPPCLYRLNGDLAMYQRPPTKAAAPGNHNTVMLGNLSKAARLWWTAGGQPVPNALSGALAQSARPGTTHPASTRDAEKHAPCNKPRARLARTARELCSTHAARCV
jgi:hypothetical protein